MTEAVKHEVKKKQEREFLGAMMVPMTASSRAPAASSLIQHAASSLLNAITGTLSGGS